MVSPRRDAPEPTGEEGDDVDLDMPRIYEPVSDLLQWYPLYDYSDGKYICFFLEWFSFRDYPNGQCMTWITGVVLFHCYLNDKCRLGLFEWFLFPDYPQR